MDCQQPWTPKTCSPVAHFQGRVPNVIVQIGRNASHPFSAAWRALNPEYGYLFFDDDDMQRYLRVHAASYRDERKVLSLWPRILTGASRSDVFRVLYLLRHGGVYVDTDSKPQRALRSVYRPDAHFVLDQHMFFEFLMFSPGHDLMRHVLRVQMSSIKAELRHRTYGRACTGSHECVIRVTGPIGFMKGVHSFLRFHRCPTLRGCTSTPGHLCPNNEPDILRAYACGVSEHLDCRNSIARRDCGSSHYSHLHRFFDYGNVSRLVVLKKPNTAIDFAATP